MSTYNPGIPLATDLISISQSAILTNFAQLNAQFGTNADADHNAFNTGSANGNGHHKQITFDLPPTPPTPAGTASNMYAAAVNSLQEMIWKNASNTTQITSGGLPIWKGGPTGNNGVVTANKTNIQGWMVLPNGIGMTWSLINNGTDNQAITFGPSGAPGWPTGSPGGFLNACWFVIPGQLRNNSPANPANGSCNVQNVSKTGFTIRTTSTNLDGFYYIAFGN